MTQQVRTSLHKLRQRWLQHTPANPLSLAEEVSPGVTYEEFCVSFLLAQRARRNVRKRTTAGHTAGTE